MSGVENISNISNIWHLILPGGDTQYVIPVQCSVKGEREKMEQTLCVVRLVYGPIARPVLDPGSWYSPDSPLLVWGGGMWVEGIQRHRKIHIYVIHVIYVIYNLNLASEG